MLARGDPVKRCADAADAHSLTAVWSPSLAAAAHYLPMMADCTLTGQAKVSLLEPPFLATD